ncbi:RSP_7527 family protein [Pseudoruegeria sp. HB172150]|uniref:RSP_7527 family protein n=1 Tax=Pseudoruegeria sp. HB172150 TaxID=2721164 RepID=UPI0015538424|nr:hypothetical protein [Pseudoruegeria sp. HB172150]
MKHLDQGRVDFAEIEREARRMQAEAVAHGFRSLRTWVRGAFKRHPEGQTL